MKSAYSEHVKQLIAVDCIIFGFDEGELKVLLYKRAFDPAKGSWSLMGGFLKHDEDLDGAARRILQNCSGLTNVFMEQLFTFGNVNRDSFDRVISVTYFSLIRIEDYDGEINKVTGASWWPVSRMPSLIFDHEEMVKNALTRLKERAKNRPIGFELLPGKFTIPHLQKLYEAIYRKKLDKRNFRKKILSMDILQRLEEKEKKSSKKGAFLYRFDKRKYKKLVEKGFHFEI